MKKTIKKSFSPLFSLKRRSSACLLAALCATSFEANAVNFASYGGAPQAALFSGTITGTNLLNLTNADPSNFTLASTNSASYTALFALSATSATTYALNGINVNPAYWSAITFGTASSSTTVASSTTGTVTSYTTATSASATVAFIAADQVSGAVIQNLSAGQLAALLNAGLTNPDSYRSMPTVLSTVATGVLTKLTNSTLVAMIPKYVRTGVMNNSYSSTLTCPGWEA